MSERIHQLAQLLPGKSSIEECSTEELQHLAKRYPYFAPLQFLLLQKLKTNGSPDFEAQQRKSVLYYHDPMQFEQFIAADKFAIDESLFSRQEEETQAALALDIKEPNQFPVIAESTADETSSFVQTKNESIAEEINTVHEAATKQETGQYLSHEQEVAEPVFLLEQPIETVDNTFEERNEDQPIDAETTPIQLADNLMYDDVNVHGKAAAETIDEAALPLPILASTPANSEEVVASRPDEAPTITSTVESPQLATLISAAPENGTLTFEPFHTVDYFASQGIKISTEELPKDKLTKQLRSFTEWLKIMKRLPATEMAKAPESSAEKSVESLASHSVAESDVVTEAMAEVWAKQGAREKAMETYNKLSLLNPSKKAYFAAKIENLKQS